MAMLHNNKQPNLRILGGLSDSLPASGLPSIAHSIALGSFMGELAFVGSQPSRRQRLVRKDKESSYSDKKSDGSLNDKKPLPTGNASLSAI